MPQELRPTLSHLTVLCQTSPYLIDHHLSYLFSFLHSWSYLSMPTHTLSNLITTHRTSWIFTKHSQTYLTPQETSSAIKTPHWSSCCIIPLSYSIFISHICSTSIKPYQNSSCVMIICCRTSSTYIAHHSLSHRQIVSSNFVSTNHTSSNIMLPHCNILPHLAHTSWHHIKPDQTLS